VRDEKWEEGEEEGRMGKYGKEGMIMLGKMLAEQPPAPMTLLEMLHGPLNYPNLTSFNEIPLERFSSHLPQSPHFGDYTNDESGSENLSPRVACLVSPMRSEWTYRLLRHPMWPLCLKPSNFRLSYHHHGSMYLLFRGRIAFQSIMSQTTNPSVL